MVASPPYFFYPFDLGIAPTRRPPERDDHTSKRGRTLCAERINVRAQTSLRRVCQRRPGLTKPRRRARGRRRVRRTLQPVLAPRKSWRIARRSKRASNTSYAMPRSVNVCPRNRVRYNSTRPEIEGIKGGTNTNWVDFPQCSWPTAVTGATTHPKTAPRAAAPALQVTSDDEINR